MLKKNIVKIIAFIFIGLTLVMTVSGLVVNNVQAKPLDDEPWSRVITIRTYVGEGYLNPNGADGYWIPDKILSINQFIMRPEIPGKVTQLSTQFSKNTADISINVDVEADHTTEIGVDNFGSTTGHIGLDFEVDGGTLTETACSNARKISLNSSSDYELVFSATLYELLITQYGVLYKCVVKEIWTDGRPSVILDTYYDLDVQNEIIGIRTIDWIGFGYDYQNSTHRYYFPRITQLYEEIVNDDMHIDHIETCKMGDGVEEFVDTRTTSTTTHGRVYGSFTVGAENDFGIGISHTTISLDVTVGGTYETTDQTGETQVATYESWFYGTGKIYDVVLKYLNFGAFWITGELYEFIDPEPEPEPIPDPEPEPIPDPKDPIDIS